MTQFPRIHLNGTDGRDLAEQYGAAITVLEIAIAAIREISVHGRDYYTINDSASSVAMHEHRQRLARLELVKAELQLIYDDIFEQMSARPGCH
jgi:hypothetical protein